jgi:outer membrane murein-binding lipoprotein Lpp/predicted Fe-Mo cluster-binding NifX family protein
MMKKKILLALIIAVLLLSFILTGCQTAGITQAQYDQLAAQLKDSQAKITEAQNDLTKLQSEKSAVDAQLKDALATINSLKGQVGGLKEQATLTGATPAETAAKIVKNYIETLVYSTIDYFICSDMASEVWNMLKAQGIKAVIVVGNKDTAISNILQSDHAWVLAEVGPGEHLALEATGGYVVTKSDNRLYYRGWSFDSPTSLKSHNELVREYNTRVSIIMDIQNEAKLVADEHDRSTDPVTADKLLAVYNKLVEVRDKMDAELKNIKAELEGLANPL